MDFFMSRELYIQVMVILLLLAFSCCDNTWCLEMQKKYLIS